MSQLVPTPSLLPRATTSIEPDLLSEICNVLRDGNALPLYDEPNDSGEVMLGSFTLQLKEPLFSVALQYDFSFISSYLDRLHAQGIVPSSFEKTSTDVVMLKACYKFPNHESLMTFVSELICPVLMKSLPNMSSN